MPTEGSPVGALHVGQATIDVLAERVGDGKDAIASPSTNALPLHATHRYPVHNTFDNLLAAHEWWHEMAVQQAQTRCLTVEDLYEMDDLPERFEVIRGEIVEMPPPMWRHTSVSGRIYAAILMWLQTHPIGVIVGADGGYVLARNPLIVLIPDISFIPHDRVPTDDAVDQIPEGAPDLVVEVVSPSDRASRVHDKVMTYLEFGAKIVWVIDPPRKTAMVYLSTQPGDSQILHVSDSMDGEDVLPGFTLSLADIFA